MSRPKGLYLKYSIEKLNGKLCDPDAQYFVLRVDTDPHARVALRAYADSIFESNQDLANDIYELLGVFDVL